MEPGRNKHSLLFLSILLTGLIVTGCKKGGPQAQQRPAQKQQAGQPSSQPGTPAEQPQQQATAVKVEEVKTMEQQVFRYEALGLVDPFEPIIGKQEGASPVSPLEQYSLDQLKLVAIIWGVSEPRAMVEDPQGKGYIIKKGTKIGKNQGVVIKILDNEVVILETYVDLLNRRKTNEVSLKLQK